MTREEFLINYWDYYMMLEKDVINITKYIKILPVNYKTCSDEIIKVLLSVSAEFEIMCKLICGLDGNSSKNINDYLTFLSENIEKFEEYKIKIKTTKSIIIKPFIIIEKTNGPKVTKTLSWWRAYNHVKHNRFEKYEEGSFLNLLNSLAALFFLEMYYIKMLGKENNELDFPDKESKLLQIINWEKNPKNYIMKLERDVEDNETIAFPLKYIVGTNMLEVYFENTKLTLTDIKNNIEGNYKEVGEDGSVSNKIQLDNWGCKINKGHHFEFIIR